jgi:hypothetical protein
MSGTGINIGGRAKVSFENTNVGDYAQMTVNNAVHARVAELLAEIEQHRAVLPDEVERHAREAEVELAQPEPQPDRLAHAMQRIREGSASVSAVAGAASAVLRALGVA